MTAKQAYRQTMRNIKSKEVLDKIDAKDEFDKVLGLIREVVGNCETGFYVDFKLKPGTIALLKEHGYNVASLGGHYIEWDHQKSFWQKIREFCLTN
jgi:hypothetical protein